MYAELFISTFSLPTFAVTDDVAIDVINFPDKNFREYVSKNFDENGDEVLSKSERDLVLRIEVFDLGITTLSGIEHFLALEELFCAGNELNSLDVSKNIALETLSFQYNNISQIDLRNNTALKDLCCYENDLTSLDISQNKRLEVLTCYDNNLNSLDVSNNVVLTELYCQSNALTSLDVSYCGSIKRLDCTDNNLTELNVSNNAALEYLFCSNNNLISLDIIDCVALQYIECDGNRLASLDISDNIALKYLNCNDNNLMTLDTSENISIKYLECSKNNLVTLNVNDNIELNDLQCEGNNRKIDFGVNGQYDLSTLTGFDVNKASNWQGGVVLNNTLYVNKGVGTIKYTYDCGRDFLKIFSFTVDGVHIHEWGTYIYNNDATTLKDGTKTAKCKYCGETNTVKATGTRLKESTKIFKDLKKSDWYVKNGAIDFVYNKNLFNGTSETQFSPNDQMTRGMFVTVLGRLHGVKANNNVKTKFVDVGKDYYTGYVKWANDNGIVSGTDTTHFSPNANVTREQICAMMMRYCDYTKIKLQRKNAVITFKDAGQISGYAKKAVKACQQGAVVNGEKKRDGYYFRPQGNATRAEVATIMMNFANNYVK